jgi:RNA polymerase sigma-70 factor, ECF subfamily
MTSGPFENESSRDALPTSRTLLQRARKNDSRAWQELVELYAPLVYFWCRRGNVIEQDIPDVVQDVFRAVVAGLGGFRKERASDTFRGWLRTVTRSKVADYYRRVGRETHAVGGSTAQRRIQRIPADIEPAEGLTPDSENTGDEQLAVAALHHRALQLIREHFDPKTWQAFWRVAVDGQSATDVAAELGMKAGTVRVAKSRVLQRLRRELGDVE